MQSRSGFATPTETFGGCNTSPNVSDGVTNPVALRFQDWLERTGGTLPDKPPAAFTAWMREYYKITGPR